MAKLIPNRFLFDFEFALRYRKKIPSITGKLTDWSDAYLLPNLGELDGEEPFAPVWACWNDDGIAIACRVENKTKSLRCDPKTFWKGDNLRLMTDMRDTRNIRRASRHCQHFFFLPEGKGKGGKEAVAGSAPINRARESAPTVAPGRINIASVVQSDGYTMEAHIPADVLHGFDPSEHGRIGFYYMLEDRDHGQQYMTVGDDLYWYVDPSTWPTAVLTREP